MDGRAKLQLPRTRARPLRWCQHNRHFPLGRRVGPPVELSVDALALPSLPHAHPSRVHRESSAVRGGVPLSCLSAGSSIRRDQWPDGPRAACGPGTETRDSPATSTEEARVALQRRAGVPAADRSHPRASPRHMQTSPGGLWASPRQPQTSPRQLQTSPRQPQTSPRQLRTSPRQARPAPRQPQACPGQLRTLPSHLYGSSDSSRSAAALTTDLVD